MELEEGEVLEVQTYEQVYYRYGFFKKYVKDDDYDKYLANIKCRFEFKKAGSGYTYDKHRRLLHVVSHKSFLIHYFGTRLIRRALG